MARKLDHEKVERHYRHQRRPQQQHRCHCRHRGLQSLSSGSECRTLVVENRFPTQRRCCQTISQPFEGQIDDSSFVDGRRHLLSSGLSRQLRPSTRPPEFRCRNLDSRARLDATKTLPTIRATTTTTTTISLGKPTAETIPSLTATSPARDDGEDPSCSQSRRRKCVSQSRNNPWTLISYFILICIIESGIFSSPLPRGVEGRPASFYAVLPSSPAFSSYFHNHNFGASSHNLHASYSGSGNNNNNNNINNNNINNNNYKLSWKAQQPPGMSSRC